MKAHEGKEVASIGVVEGSNLYVVSGGDVVSPKLGRQGGHESHASTITAG